MGLAPEAAPLLDRLTKEFEKSEYLLKAQRTLTDIQNGTIGSFRTPRRRRTRGSRRRRTRRRRSS